MAVGDVVVGLAINSVSFQPAAGVEVVLTSFGINQKWAQLYDGTNYANVFYFADNNAGGQNTGTGQGSGGAKLCINNSVYFRGTPSAYNDGGFYSGIQIK